MSELKSVVYYDQEEDQRMLEIQFYPDKCFLSIEWAEGGGMRAESFTLTASEIRSMAELVLKTIPDPMILEDNLAAL